MKKHILSFIILLGLSPIILAQKPINKTPQSEIIYHVCQRSFYDSNGDLNGDLNGLRAKLNYLQDLGITSILLMPLYEADCYHNYFANDFEKIDTEFGTMKEYIELVKDIHQRGMKIYIDMETQYVTSKHEWWKDAVGNPNSKYSNYILFDDKEHTTPSSMIFDLREFRAYDGTIIKVTTVNLKSKEVLNYNIGLFSYFIDPNKDGKFDDGVDGFRLDHAMDHLDAKPTLNNLFVEFWKPLITVIKKVNPSIKIVAEQADWNDYGFEYFEKATVDRMFGFGLKQAILSFDKQQLKNKADTILNLLPAGKENLVFIENHDLDRFASLETNIAKQKVAAALMFLMGGIPSMYYGQELGMKGTSYSFGNTDGNDIGRREAFEWYQSGEGKGMAYWYQNTGAWWTNANAKPNDGISLEEQLKDPNSLFLFYKKIIALRKSNAALSKGKYVYVESNNKDVFSFYRIDNKQRVLVTVNLSNQTQVERNNNKFIHAKNLLNKNKKFQKSMSLQAYEIDVWDIGFSK